MRYIHSVSSNLLQELDLARRCKAGGLFFVRRKRCPQMNGLHRFIALQDDCSSRVAHNPDAVKKSIAVEAKATLARNLKVRGLFIGMAGKSCLQGA